MRSELAGERRPTLVEKDFSSYKAYYSPDNRARIVVEKHRAMQEHKGGPELTETSTPVLPAAEGLDRASIIEKGTSMIEPERTFSPREFITVTEMAARLKVRANLGGTKEDETLAVFPAANGREITIQHRTTEENASVNIAFLNTDGKVEKRIVVGTNFRDEGHFGNTDNARDFQDNYTHPRDAKKPEALYFNGDNQPHPFTGEDAKFVGTQLFIMALK